MAAQLFCFGFYSENGYEPSNELVVSEWQSDESEEEEEAEEEEDVHSEDDIFTCRSQQKPITNFVPSLKKRRQDVSIN